MQTIGDFLNGRGALQSELAKHVVLKYTPRLVFHLDDSIERGTRVIEILQGELKLVMGNCGTRTVADINRSYIATPDWKI